MRNTVCSLALTGFLAIGLACTASAQNDTSGQTQTDQQTTTTTTTSKHMHHHEMNADRDLARMTKHLKLTQDEQSQIKPILQNRDDQLNQLWQDSSMSKTDRQAKAKDIREDANSKITPILTPDQQQKFSSMQSRHEHHHHTSSTSSTDTSSPQPQ